MINLEPTQADYDQLLKQMPAAEERLKTIILTRMITERDRRIAELEQGRTSEEPVSDKLEAVPLSE